MNASPTLPDRLRAIQRAFLDDILASPDDDTPRLIYADWLEEQAEGVGSTGEFPKSTREDAPTEYWYSVGPVACLAWARLIRVQCELSPLRSHGHGVFRHRGGECPECLRVARLERTERECYEALFPLRLALAKRLLVEWHRGFIEHALGSVESWMHDGPQLVRSMPLRRVTLLGRQPVRGLDGWHWRMGCVDDDSGPDGVPAEIMAHGLWDEARGIDRRPVPFETEEEAKRALSRAAIAWARSQPIDCNRLSPAPEDH